MVVQCCVCGKIRTGDRWYPLEEPLDPDAEVSHGYCPRCAAEAFAEMKRFHDQRRHLRQADAFSA